MTSGQFQTYPISSVMVSRDDRQRRALSGIEDLAESLHRVGQINPIVITRDGALVAGERRLTAAKSLGWTAITVQFVDELTEYELQIIELEENVKRVDLPWQDECMAVSRFHALKVAHEPDWTQVKTAEALGISTASVTPKLAIAKEIKNGNEKIAGAERFSVARNLVTRVNERRRDTVLEDAPTLFTPQVAEEQGSDGGCGGLSGEVQSVETVGPPLLLEDFHAWSAAYAGPAFNLIHCDFPYGINVADSPRQSAGIQEHYEDSPDIYWALIDTLESCMSNGVVALSAHLLFWFSMDFYQPTLDKLNGMGWKVDPFPLIWHKSDNSGIAPDPQRRSRRTYETAFFASRGDRKLTSVGARANSFAHPGRRGPDGIHLSEKPVKLLTHFMSMVCDEYSIMLDPTCGSGNAMKAAEALGAYSVLGLEKSEDFYLTSVARYYGEE